MPTVDCPRCHEPREFIRIPGKPGRLEALCRCFGGLPFCEIGEPVSVKPEPETCGEPPGPDVMWETVPVGVEDDDQMDGMEADEET